MRDSLGAALLPHVSRRCACADAEQCGSRRRGASAIGGAAARLAAERFNAGNAREGLALLVDAGALPLGADDLIPCPVAVARGLVEREDLCPAQVGRFLCKSPREQPVLAAFVRQFDWTNRPLDEALRELLRHVELPEPGADQALGPGHPCETPLREHGSKSPATSRSATKKALGFPSAPFLSPPKRLRRRLSRTFSRSSMDATRSTRSRSSSRAQFGHGDNADELEHEKEGTPTHHSPGSASSPGGAPGSENVGSGSPGIKIARKGSGFRSAPGDYGAADADDDDAWYDGRRMALKLFSQHYWNLNCDVMSVMYDSSHTLFAIVLQLFSLSLSVLRDGSRGTPRSRNRSPVAGSARAGRRKVPRAKDWESFSQGCQDAFFSLAGTQLPTAHLQSMFDRIVSQPFLAAPAQVNSPQPNTSNGQPEPIFSEDLDFSGAEHEGFLWLDQASVGGSGLSRLWFVLQDWTLYGLDAPPALDRASRLACVIPLDDVKPLLQHMKLELDGPLKIAPAPRFGKLLTPRRKNRTRRLFPRRSLRFQFKRNNRPPQPIAPTLVCARKLVLTAQTAADAGRWYRALSRARSSPQAGAAVEFVQNIDGLKDRQLRRPQHRPAVGPRSVFDQVLDATREDVIRGVLLVRRDGAHRPDKGSHHLGGPGGGFQKQYCSLVHGLLIIANDSSSVRKGTVVDLSQLRIAIPSTNQWARDHGFFPFELIGRDLQPICICAATTLKDYTLWFKAFSALTPSQEQRDYISGDRDDPTAKKSTASYGRRNRTEATRDSSDSSDRYPSESDSDGGESLSSYETDAARPLSRREPPKALETLEASADHDNDAHAGPSSGDLAKDSEEPEPGQLVRSDSMDSVIQRANRIAQDVQRYVADLEGISIFGRSLRDSAAATPTSDSSPSDNQQAFQREVPALRPQPRAPPPSRSGQRRDRQFPAQSIASSASTCSSPRSSYTFASSEFAPFPPSIPPPVNEEGVDDTPEVTSGRSSQGADPGDLLDDSQDDVHGDTSRMLAELRASAARALEQLEMSVAGHSIDDTGQNAPQPTIRAPVPEVGASYFRPRVAAAEPRRAGFQGARSDSNNPSRQTQPAESWMSDQGERERMYSALSTRSQAGLPHGRSNVSSSTAARSWQGDADSTSPWQGDGDQHSVISSTSSIGTSISGRYVQRRQHVAPLQPPPPPPETVSTVSTASAVSTSTFRGGPQRPGIQSSASLRSHEGVHGRPIRGVVAPRPASGSSYFGSAPQTAPAPPPNPPAEGW